MYSSAIYWADKAISLSHESTEDVYNHIQCLLASGEYQRVISLLTHGRWENLPREHLVFAYLTAVAYSRCSQYEELVQFLEEAAENDFTTVYPNTVPWKGCQLGDLRGECHVLLANALEKLENYEASRDHYLKALHINPLCFEAMEKFTKYMLTTDKEVLKEIEAITSKIPSRELRDLTQFLYHEKVTFSDPIQIKEIPIKFKAFEHNPELRLIQADRLFNHYKFEETYNVTSSILEMDPYNPEVLILHIGALVQLKKKSELYRIGHRLVDAYPDSALAWYAAGCYYYCVGKQEDARKMFSKATLIDRQFGYAWMASGQSLAMEGERDHAITLYNTAARVMNKCHLPKMYIGLEYMFTGNYNFAANSLLHSRSITPQDPILLQEIGVLYYTTGKYQGAEKFLTQAIQNSPLIDDKDCSPQWEVLYFNLGQVYKKLAEYDKAMLYYKKAIALCPDTPSTLSSMAHVHLMLGNYNDCICLCERVLMYNRNDHFTTLIMNYAIEEQVHVPLSFDLPPDLSNVPHLANITTCSSLLDSTVSIDLCSSL